MTQAERITALEVQVAHLVTELQKTNEQLAALLALRNKGAGAFWLASMLFGTSLVGLVTTFIHWMK